MKDGKIKLILLGLIILLITDSGYAKYEPVYGYYGSLIGLLLIFSGEDFIQSLFFYMLLMYGMTSLVDKKELCKNKHIRYINT